MSSKFKVRLRRTDIQKSVAPRADLSPTEDAIAQKQIGEPDNVGAYNVGKCNGGVPSVA